MRHAMICIVGLALVLSAGCEEAGFSSRKIPEKKFSAKVSGPVTMDPGGKATLTLTITRDEGFQGPVSVRLGSIPRSVELVSGEEVITGTEATFVFKAKDDASPISRAQVPVFLSSETGGKVTVAFGVNINAKPQAEAAAEPGESGD